MKIKTYLGFSVKSNQIVYGIDNLITTKKKVHLIVACKTLTDNGLNQLLKFANKNKIEVVSPIEETLSELINRNNCKIIGLTNGNLCKAILNCEQEIKIIYKG